MPKSNFYLKRALFGTAKFSMSSTIKMCMLCCRGIGFLKATPLLAFHAALEEQATCTTKLYVLCCRGICFLNATPFWAFMPHRESIPRALTALLPWDGSLPPPRPLRFLIQNIWWRALRQKRLLNSLLRLVYRNR